ncbi:hypothetical protein [Flavobacterium sp. TR2]|uniref:hypothetical protein n=1 Tax=Flavobacterium sp. TR2 TaxID=2977321 RepID=UPI0021B0DCE6|nr:hypothetical protein [Flavobacterium sp. TR2]UWY28130.1 hypothetical protein N4T20_20705 [Flavobacterium sp. TR2]
MKKNKLIIVFVLLLVISCKNHNKGYIIIHSNNKDMKILHYFNANNEEYARVYGDSKEDDSIKFTIDKNDLLVSEFVYNQELRKRIVRGTIRYVNYTTSITDIKYSLNVDGFMNIKPIMNLDFLEKDKEIEKIIKENCKTSMSNKEKKIFSDCNFIFPQLNKIDYLPDNSKIVSIEIVKNKRKQFQKINLQANYFNIKIDYERCYYYDGKNIQKIKTFIKDSISTDIIMDYYSRINLD